MPCEDNYLRENASKRIAYRVGRFDNLPFPIELSLTELISSEIRYLRRVEAAKESLLSKADYNNYGAFRLVDRFGDGYLNIDSLRQFYR